MQGVITFLDELASDKPVPGGGSAAALETALGASLIAMVAGLTMGRKKYASVENRAQEVRLRALGLRDAAIALIEDDSASYQKVADALALPRQTDEEKTIRRERIQDGMKGATEPPLQTMRVATEVIELAREIVEFGNASAMSDAGTGSHASLAGYEAALLNVETNLQSIDDVAWVANVREKLAGMTSPHETHRATIARVQAIIHRSPG
jgi:formiminotetrahydrofolate cyclodeaminase